MRNEFEDAIIDSLENLKDQMVTGWPDEGIPPLDPLVLERVPIHIDHKGTRFVRNIEYLFIT